MKRTPLAYRSRKRTALYIARRKLVQSLLAEHPWCQVPGCESRSEVVHEPLTRARGGSILDPDFESSEGYPPSHAPGCPRQSAEKTEGRERD